MAKKQPEGTVKKGAKHPLIVYRFIANRYRPSGFILLLAGLATLLPTLIPDLSEQLNLQNSILTPTRLGWLGCALLFAGAGIWLLTFFIQHRAYVQCKPDYLLIHLAFRRVAVAYQRINSIQPVQVARNWDMKSLKSRDRALVKPLAGETAVEVELASFPMDEKKLKRRLGWFMFSTRTQGFVFIVPKPTALSVEINSYIQESKDTRDAEQQRYLDPIERLKYQNSGRSF